MAGFNVAIRNYSGVPVIDLVGIIDSSSLFVIGKTMERLVQAGHYNAVLNLRRAKWTTLDMLAQLGELAGIFRTHYGNLGVIVQPEQITVIREKSVAELLRILQFCTSEDQALARIKRLPGIGLGDSKPITAKFADSL